MDNSSSEQESLFTSSLASRLYPDSSTYIQSTKDRKSRGPALSLSRSTPVLKKQNELVTKHLRDKVTGPLFGGDVQALFTSPSPGKSSGSASRLKATESRQGATDKSLRFDSTAASIAEPALKSFIESINLPPSELFDLFHVPQYFLYLQRKSSSDPLNPVPNSVYSLERVSQAKVDKVVYFTLSKAGVTQFTKDASYFTSLQQWEREYRIFNKIASVNFFKLYKRWKVLTQRITLPALTE